MKNVGLRYEGWGFVFGGTGLRQGVPIERDQPECPRPVLQQSVAKWTSYPCKRHRAQPVNIKPRVSQSNIIFEIGSKKPLEHQAEINLFLSASPQTASSTSGKVKYFTGALSYSTKIQSDSYVKYNMNIYMLHPPCAV